MGVVCSRSLKRNLYGRFLIGELESYWNHLIYHVMLEPRMLKEWVPPSGWQGSAEDPFVPSCVHGMASRG